MLTKAFSKRPKTQYLQKVSNSLMRWLCFALLLALIIFIVTLVRLSWESDKQIEIEIEKQEKGPDTPCAVGKLPLSREVLRWSPSSGFP